MSNAKDLSRVPQETSFAADINALKQYTGRAKQVIVSGYLPDGRTFHTAGVYVRDNTDTTTVGDNYTVVQANNGVRWKRQFMKSQEAFKNQGRAIQLIRAKAYYMNNLQNGIVNIGDSISHGAYARNLYTNGWMYLLSRAVNAEFGGKAIGEFPMEGLHPNYNDPNLFSPQLADVVFSGTDWGPLNDRPAPYQYPLGNFGPYAPNSVNGKTYSSSVAGATITLTFPTMCRLINFKYTRKPGNGAFKISVNGTDALTVDTDGVLAYNMNTNNVNVVDNGKGECVVVITKLDNKPVEINAVYNLKSDSIDITDLGNRMQVHNYAQAGRALYYMTENAIINVCNSACLIVSLGFNDYDLGCDTDDTIFNQFKQRIDWLIKYAKVYQTLVIVQDFVWYASLDQSRTRQQLERLACEVNGIYVPYPDQFRANGSQPSKGSIPDSIPPELNTPAFLWADAAHPNKLGNELIFSTLARVLGLGVNSRTLALRYHDWEFPIKIKATTDAVNYSSIYPGSLTSIQQVGDWYHVRINVKPSNTANFESFKLYNLCDDLPAKFREKPLALSHKVDVSSYNYGTGAAKTFGIIEQPRTLNVFSNQNDDPSCLSNIIVREIV